MDELYQTVRFGLTVGRSGWHINGQMYARRSARRSSPEAWASSFVSRRRIQEGLSLLKLRTRRDPRWRALEPCLTAGSRILDVGSGLGSWALFLDRRGHEVIGVDYSLPLLVRASQRDPGNSVGWASALAEQLPFSGGTFDCIVSWGIIEHDPAGPSVTLAEFRRVLVKGGHVVVTVPLDGPRQRRAEQIVNAGRARDEFYEYYFTPDELRVELETAGFDEILTRPITRSVHVAYPATYRWLSKHGPVTRDFGTQLLKPLATLRADGFHMLLGIGTR